MSSSVGRKRCKLTREEPIEKLYDCDYDDFDCDDFSTREEAQACLDHCWTQAGCDIHYLDGDGDGIVCEPALAPGAQQAALLVW
jgi:hypothetical protein